MLSDKNIFAVLAVKDMEAAKKFYGETLGLKAMHDEPDGTLYSSGGGKVFVYPSSFAGTNQATAAGWDVDDIEPLIADLKAKGITFEHYDSIPGVTLNGDIHEMEGMKAVWFKDPSGNILNITSRS